MEMDLPDIAVVGMDDPVGIVSLLESKKGADFGLDGNAPVNGAMPMACPSKYSSSLKDLMYSSVSRNRRPTPERSRTWAPVRLVTTSLIVRIIST